MIVKVLCLDDDEVFAEDLQYNISSLKPEFFKKFDTSITKIELVVESDTEKAFEKINSDDEIKLLILDIELKAGKEGHQEYERLFYQGKAIPAIVVSAFANTPKRIQEIKSKGISVIIDKLRQENLSEEIAKQICFVLENRVERILQIRAMIERLRIHSKPLEISGETKPIREWVKILAIENPSGDLQNKIKQEITNECIRHFEIEKDHSTGFTRQDL